MSNEMSTSPTDSAQSVSTTSTQPTYTEVSHHVHDSFSSFCLHDSDQDEPSSPQTRNYFDDDEGYSTPTLQFVDERDWVYHTPTKPAREPVCPGAPKRKQHSSLFDSVPSPTTLSQSLPSESMFGPKGIQKQKKYRKTSPHPIHASRRRSSFPNIRLDFSNMEVNDEGQSF